MGYAILLVNLVWAYWAGRIASDHGLSPGTYRVLGFFAGPIGVLLSVGFVRRDLRRDHRASGSTLPIRSLPSWGAPIVVSVLALAPIGWYGYRTAERNRTEDSAQTTTPPPVIPPPVMGPDAIDPKLLLQPKGLAVDSAGTVYIADDNHDRVVKLPKSGAPVTVASGIMDPLEVSIDPSGAVFVHGALRTWRLPTNGTGEATALMFDGEPKTLFKVAVDGSGRMFAPRYQWVAELSTDGSERKVFSTPHDTQGVALAPSGALLTAANDTVYEHRGSRTTSRRAEGREFAFAVAYDAEENIYVAFRSEVVRFGRDGTQTTVGSVPPASSGDGLQGMAVDAAGNVYVTLGNQLIEWPAGGGQKVLLG